jgi:hypothetical protein
MRRITGRSPQQGLVTVCRDLFVLASTNFAAQAGQPAHNYLHRSYPQLSLCSTHTYSSTSNSRGPLRPEASTDCAVPTPEKPSTCRKQEQPPKSLQDSKDRAVFTNGPPLATLLLVIPTQARAAPEVL